MLDSGGFALSSRSNSKWTVDVVGDFIEMIDADLSVTLDFPPGLQDSTQSRLKKIRRSVRNYEILAGRFPKKPIMPVIHGRNMREIALSIELLVSSGESFSWIGLGGIVPLLLHRATTGLDASPEIFIAQVLTLLKAEFPRARIHVFGAGGTRTFPAMVALGADSADSIGWRQAAGFGSIFLPMKSQRTVKWNSEKKPPRKLLDKSDLLQIERCKCPICRPFKIEERIAAFQRHFHSRAIHNAWTIIHQRKSWPNSRKQLRVAIANGVLGEKWAAAVSEIP